MVIGRHRRFLGLLLACLGTTAEGAAQARVGGAGTRDAGVVALHQAVRDATSDALILLIASHPDDRYMLPATYLRFHEGYRVAVLLVTRGRGGQNSLGPQTGDALGRLRTLEAERSAAHFGARLYYLNRPDNGFSRSAEETLDQWGERSTVAAMARMIRLIQPDVIVTTHNPDEKHGHDLALLQVLPKAVAVAKDAEVEIPGMPAFEVRRVFRAATTEEGDEVCISLPMGKWDYDRGATYRQLAYRALAEHQSQVPFQPMDELFEPILELVPIEIDDEPAKTTLVEGLPTLFSAMAQELPAARVRGLRDRFAQLPALRSDRRKLAEHAIALLRDLRQLEPTPGSDYARRLARRIRALSRVVQQSAAVHVFIEETRREAAPGDDMPLQVWIRNEGQHVVSGIRAEAIGGGTLEIEGRDRTRVEPEESLALHATYCPPDLSERDLRRLFSKDTYEPPLRVRFTMAIDGQPIRLEQAIDTALQPGLKLTVTPRTLLLAKDASRVRFVVEVERKTSKPVDLQLSVIPPAAMTVDENTRQVTLAAKERYREFTFTLNAPNVRPGVSVMHLHAGGFRQRIRVHKVDVAVPEDLRVGFLPGYDTATYEVLQALIGNDRLEKFEKQQPIPILDNKRFDTIVVDIRALRAEGSFKRGFARLLEFVKQGGRLVVFYHKDKEFNLEEASFRGAPYPLRIGKGRVTREDAVVEVLAPDHPLFNYPNVIRREDWDGWKQERGLYFPETYDPTKYQELLEMADEGEPPERGSLLYARYGKGDYIYCALSLYRQLKNRHAGACRLFANLISKKPGK